MALEGEHGVIARHPFAVIRHTQEPAPAPFDINLYPARPGINRVFNQLFSDRRRTLDHLTGGDLIGKLVGKDANLGHLKIENSGLRTQNEKTDTRFILSPE